MRILCATPWTGFWEVGAKGGVPDEYLTLRALVRGGHDVEVVAPGGADYVLDEGPGSLTLHTVPYPAQRVRGRYAGQLGRLRDVVLARRAFGGALERIANRLRPDLYLAHSFHTAPWVAPVAARHDRPIVAKFFGVLELNTEWQPRWIHFLKHFEHYLAFRRRYTRAIVLDDGTGGDEAARRLGMDPARLLFWPNGVDVDWAERPVPTPESIAATRRRLALPAAPVLVLTLCNLLPLKRVDRLIEAVREVPEVHAVIGGDGEERQALANRAAQMGIGDRVHMIGAVDHDDVPELIEAIDIYVAPHDLTNAGIPTCESMLCARPVVALDIGHTRRLVEDGASGIVVPLEAGVMGLATAVRRLVHDPDLRAQMGARGRAIARQRFVSWEARVAMEVELLESLVTTSEVARSPRLS